MTKSEQELKETLDNLLTMALLMHRTNMGIIQLLDPQTGLLEIACQRGFGASFLQHFKQVGINDSSASARALRTGDIVIVEDITSDPSFSSHKIIALSSGYRSVQSTPLISSTGTIVGVLSTHFPVPRNFSEEELTSLREYGHRAADIIEDLKKE